MNQSLIQIGVVQAQYSAAGTRVLKYSVELFHKGLREHKLLSAPETTLLQNKVDTQIQKWEEKWDNYESKRKTRESKESNQEEAKRRTGEAASALEEINNLLFSSQEIPHIINWETLKKTEAFKESTPEKPKAYPLKVYPEKPDITSPEYTPVFTISEKLFQSKKDKKMKEIGTKYESALTSWEKEKERIDRINSANKKEYDQAIDKWNIDFRKWERKKNEYLNEIREHNAHIENLKINYSNKEPDAVIEYCEIVLDNASLPDAFPNNYELDYNPDNKILIIEYELPSIEDLPNIKEVKYLASKNELKEVYLTENQLNSVYDEALYKIALRILEEIFSADVINALDAISFNGWVKAINKGTGKEENNCILTIQAKKEEMQKIDLKNVDPKICFRNLKGVASSKLSSLTPVQPIMQISRYDRRFVESYEVANQLDNSTNIAAMDWQDFEHLIREIFEKEFQVNGGEVKVTQASRDGGVDAIAFDPDPIRGGKIVIQAKRYTNTVGVSAVRDLYGTVVNEGATKGILVSTSVYGPDAYEFAKGKPITLLDGANLLYLLEKHGYRAKIDVKEAKRLLSEKET